MITLEKLAALYGAAAEDLVAYPSHEGGRNTVYRCGEKVIRVSEAADRRYADYLAETEYVHYLAQHGADAVDVVPSVSGKLVEQVDGAFVSAFTVAKGEQIAEHGYRYRDGAPLSEYFYNTGKVLGKIHALSKRYQPVHQRFDFFEKYNETYFEQLIPDEFAALKQALHGLLEKLRALPQTDANYGMVHFDFSDGNYNIDYDTGKLTVFDFENCRRCFYLFDLANLWTHGVGWIAYEADAEKRRAFMQDYFATVLEGYRAETEISEDELALLPLMIRAVLMENIIDEFEVQKAETGGFELDEEQAYNMDCVIEEIEYHGFFDEIYDPERPFQMEL